VSPGFPFQLVLEPKNKHDANAVAIFDQYNNKAGYVPAEKAERIGINIKNDQYEYCLSVWQKLGENGPVQVRALLVDRGISLGIPRATRKFIDGQFKTRLLS